MQQQKKKNPPRGLHKNGANWLTYMLHHLGIETITLQHSISIACSVCGCDTYFDLTLLASRSSSSWYLSKMARHSAMLRFRNCATSLLISCVFWRSIRNNLATSSCGPNITRTNRGYSSSRNRRCSGTGHLQLEIHHPLPCAKDTIQCVPIHQHPYLLVYLQCHNKLSPPELWSSKVLDF